MFKAICACAIHVQYMLPVFLSTLLLSLSWIFYTVYGG
jgi:hypothetical protein